MTHPNATPVKAIYLDEFIYEEGTPIGKCYQCDLPNPFTNYQVVREGVDYVKHYEHWCNNKSTLNGIDTKLFDTTLEQYNKDAKCPDCYLKVIALPIQAERREGEKVLGEWQLCPKCLGEGFVPGKGVSVHDVCDVCNGAKILAKPLITNKG